MFALAQQQVESPKRSRRHAARWRLTVSGPGELHVALLRSTLRYDELRPLFDWLVGDRSADWRTITFDFGQVHDVSAPWVPVFAHLEYVASKTRADCRLVGLNTRLTSMASFTMGAVAPGELRLGTARTA